MIRKILIANRGEIACRIMRTCREMGIDTVAVFSDADANALHVHMAGEAVHVGGSPALDSYLNIEKMIAAAQRTGADAVHPGYGFLAENAAFAQAVIDAGLTFIGPMPATIDAMGKKREAKRILKNVPLVPGYSGDDQSDGALIKAATKIGYPLMVKASAGGGGKGMRRVDTAEAIADALAAARREAQQAFGDDTLILEKFIENPRHIEIQIIGDTHGNVIPLGERECSIQRRHQKIIEETPSPALDVSTRERMSQVAVDIGKQLKYVGAGTVEFLLDEQGAFYFMEMNTRLQVEHPVTEMVYGQDLVKIQIDIAEGGTVLNIGYDFTPHGHAIEARIYAEDPANGFLPAIGRILHWGGLQAGVRYDVGVRSGDTVTVYYDPMVAKVIAHAEHREQAIRKLAHALKHLTLLGVHNNIHFLRRVLDDRDFITGETTTLFIDTHTNLVNTEQAIPTQVIIAATLGQQQRLAAKNRHRYGHWRNTPGTPMKHTFRNHKDSASMLEIALIHRKEAGEYRVQSGEHSHVVTLLSYLDDEMVLRCDGHQQHMHIVCADDVWWVHYDGETYALAWQTPLPLPGANPVAAGSLRAPMPGQVISIHVEVGQQVTKDDILVTLEAMKMEHRIQAPYDGIVGKIHFALGATVQADAILLELDTLDDPAPST